jgi:peptidoglycan/xylan/chitin deacetylase (PgdA/CDA1 family)
MYHSIADDGPEELEKYRVSPKDFRQQMQLLREWGYNSIALSDWAFSIATKRFVPGRPVVITFDDGYHDFASNAWPILTEANLRATIFIVIGRVGAIADWDRTAQPGLALMGWDELRVMQENGNTIGSHCVAHRLLTKLSDEAIAADAILARSTLRRELGSEAIGLSYPWGESDARVQRICLENGYRVGVGVTPSVSGLNDNPMNLPRVEIFGSDDFDTFAQKLRASNMDNNWSPPRRMQISSPQAAAPPPSSRTDLVVTLSARLQCLIEEVMSIKHELDGLRTPAPSLREKVLLLFARPLTTADGELLTPHVALSPGIRAAFEPTARLQLTVLPKHDHGVSPDCCLNVLRFGFAGVSRWLYIDVALAWPELENAEQFQLNVALSASRETRCRAVIRLWQKDKQYVELTLAEFALDPNERNYDLFGALALPDPLALDHASEPMFVLLFDTDADLEFELSYLNLYFA